MAESLPSIVDVAQRAGVSVATASRVMSNANYPVSEGTRQKVLKAAEELKYVPNSLARSLKAQRSKLIAVIVGDNADPYFAEVTRGVEEVANAQGYLTIVCNTDRNPQRELSYLQTLQDYRADGIIFAGSSLNEPGYSEQVDAMVQQMVRRGAAIVTLSQHTLHVPSVQTDNFRGTCDLTARLIELGHRRIAFITGPTNLTAANVRLQGYMAALAQANIPIDHTLLIPGNFTQAGGEQAAHSLMAFPLEQRPTAVFASNDETAFGALATLQQHGWHVPGDISVCGFGDLPMAAMVMPALTTVRIGLRDLGRTGVHKLFALLKNEDVPWLEVFPTTIIERASTAPVQDE